MTAADLDYVARKNAHMKRMGIEVGVGLYGGACPKWLEKQREEDGTAAAYRFNARRVSNWLADDGPTLRMILEAITRARRAA